MIFHQYYIKPKQLLLLLLIGFFSFLTNLNYSESYYFGLKSADNTPENIEIIEKKLNIKLPIVSFIFDPRDKHDVLNSIDKIVEILGSDRIYHFTISPDMFSAEDVIMGKFDEQYTAFFKKIKEKDLHVIFRTMHEMNGGRYPRSSDPENFKTARIHVRRLSRVAGLDKENIAFDFSVNHRDMPTKGTPSQDAILIECPVGKTDCYHFEDYYPGDDFVDVIGFTFYNRGKAIGNRQWLSPTQILYDPKRKTYERLQSFNKPIIIDEVATTSVRYEGNYDFEKSKSEYLNHNERKNLRLGQLWDFLISHPDIIATIYFNVDYTHGLNLKITGEADWAIINIDNNKIYNGFNDLEVFGEKNLNNILKNIFKAEHIQIDGYDIFISSSYLKEIRTISIIINSKTEDINEKIQLIQKLKTINFKSTEIKKALNKLLELYIRIKISEG